MAKLLKRLSDGTYGYIYRCDRCWGVIYEADDMRVDGQQICMDCFRDIWSRVKPKEETNDIIRN